jgi:hypothetical protein
VDHEKWPSVMGDYNGVTLRKNDDCCRTYLGLSRARGQLGVQQASERPASKRGPSASSRARARPTAHMVLLTHSSEATVNNVSSATARIYNFQEAMGVPVVPPVWCPSVHSPPAAGWYMAHRASKVEVQSLSSDSSAFNQLYYYNMLQQA